MPTGKRRRLLWWLAGAIVIVVVVAAAAPFVYIHFIEGPAPQKLQLPAVKSTTSTSARGSVSSTSTASAAGSALDGTWNVGTGSLAGYRVQEVLVGQSTTAVGRTDKVWGSLTISGSNVTKASFTVDMASVTSDQSGRNAQFDGRIMDVAQYPTAVFTLTSPIALGTIPAGGVVGHYTATGTLTMHGVTKTVTFPVSAERAGGPIDVLADVPIAFSDWNIANPSMGGIVTTADNGTLEVLLNLTQGPGNAPSTSTPSGGFPGGGPITVPSTTVPPLSVPNG